MTMMISAIPAAKTIFDVIQDNISNLTVKNIADMIYVGGNEWRFSSNDPSIVFELNQKNFKNNTCLLIFDARPTRPGAVGKLYVDYGAGFSETATANIDYSRGDSALAILTDADRIRTLRWDPDDQDGAGIRIEHLQIIEADSTIEDFVQDYVAQSRLTEKHRKIFPTFFSRLQSVFPKTATRKQEEAFVRLNAAVRHRGSGTSLVLSPGGSADAALAGTLFVIPSINGAHLLERMLPSLDLPKSCIVVLDQGSTDGTEAVCRRSGVEMIQLGTPRTYTQACNIGLELATQRGIQYLYISNNDIRFVTHVAQELLAEMVADDRLAIVAPSQIIVDERKNARLLANRVQWDLSSLSFFHDFQSTNGKVERIEADFCELTCALIRVRAATEIGGFDDEFGFYHEDADLCFRLREAKYTCAYLPRSQIEHYASSTFGDNLSEAKKSYLLNSKQLFARKHMGFGVDHADHKSDEPTSWNIVNRHLHPYLRRNGLIDGARPELIFSHPGTKPLDYLYSVWETDKLPEEWLPYASSYRAIFNPSRWVCDVFEKAGYENIHYLPHGVETDTFHPWGASERQFDEKTYLWFGRNQYRKGLDVMLRAWQRFRVSAPNAKLIVMGHAVLADYQHYRNDFRRWRGCIVLDLPRDGIQFRETIDVMSDHELAIIYRSVDFLVSTARSEGFGFSVVEAMASGLTPIFPGYAGGSDMIYEGALTIAGTPAKADYRDKGFDDVGNWWEPDVESVAMQLDASLSMSDRDRRRLDRTALRMVRSDFTWRQTCTWLRSALKTMQLQADVGYRPPVEPEPKAMLDVAIALEKEDLRTGRRSFNPDSGHQTCFEDFNPEHYLRYNPDVRAVGANPLLHFTEHGWRENRPMSPYYTVSQLLAANRSVRQRLLHQAGIVLEPEVAAVPEGQDDDAQSATVPPVHSPRHIADHANPKPGALFIGYVEAGLGLGESLRGLIKSVSSTAVDPKIYPFNVLVRDRYIGRFHEEKYDLYSSYKVNVFEMAADQLPAAFDELGKWRTGKSYNIFRTYWELSKADPSWRESLSKIDELWAPTNFIADAFRHVYDGKITIVPTIVDVDRRAMPDRKLFGLDENKFYFVFSFDYYSMTARKNPSAVLRAFEKAFPGGEDVGLVIKSIGPRNVDANARVRAEIDRFMKKDARVVLVDRSLSREHMTVLLKSCDCYVSLHRSEGFGLGMAESMMLSKPVIGTAYGGCTDFLSEKTGFPVSYTLRRVMHGEYPFSDKLAWAEPDIDDAAAHMRTVFTDRALADTRARAAHRFIVENFGAETVGAIAVDRIEEILDTGRRPGTAAAKTVSSRSARARIEGRSTRVGGIHRAVRFGRDPREA